MSDQSAPIVSGQQALSADQASRLLRIGLIGPIRPSDPLLERLSESDGTEWLVDAVSSGPIATSAGLETILSADKCDLDQLRIIKQRCTESALHDPPAARLVCMASYFLVVAAALAHFRTNLSSRTPDELKTVFVELAAVTPAQWADIFTKAIAVLSESC